MKRRLQLITVWAVLMIGLPAIDSDKYRLGTSLYGGIGARLDRFSAFRLPCRPTGFEWEAWALPTLSEARSVVG